MNPGAWLEALERLDQRLFVDLNHALHVPHHADLHSLMRLCDQLGNGWTAGLIVGAVFLLVQPRARALARGAELGLTLVGAGLVDRTLKVIVSRPRPEMALGDAFGRGEVFHAFADHGGSFSFPSGHTVTAFATAVILCLWARRLPGRPRRIVCWTGLLLLATGTGVARIYVGVHYPGDVLAGAALGTACAFAGHGIALAVASVNRRVRTHGSVPAPRTDAPR